MNLFGDKVILRAIEGSDKDMFLSMINDPETEKMLIGMSYPVSVMEQEKWISSQVGVKSVLRCVVADREAPERGLGTVILSDVDTKNGTAKVHIKLLRDIRGKGYGTDALRTMVRYAFDELRINCIYADNLSYNIASQKLFEKVGFKKEGVLRARVYKNGAYADLFSYSLLRDEFFEAEYDR